MESILFALSDSWVAGIMFGWTWSWPIAETIHFFGMTILFGALLVTDLRLLGFFKSMPIQATHTMINLAIFGFVLNLITGIAFFCGDPFRYTYALAFQLKVVFLVIAGLNAAFFTFKLQPTWGDWDPHGDAPQAAKISAAISLVSWALVIIFGRLIPYL